MSGVLIPILGFLAGLVAGGLIGWCARPRLAPEEARPRLPAWKVVVGTALLTSVLLIGVGLAVARLVLRPRKTSRVTVEQAVAEYRQGRQQATPATSGLTPPGGVYTYRATGFYEVTVPVVGKERRDLPATVPGILQPEGACWSLTIRYFQQHEWKGHYCREPSGALRLLRVENRNEMFGMKTQGESRCSPDLVSPAGARAGDTWKLTCTSTPPRPEHQSGQADLRGSYLGEETLTIAGQPVRAHHVRRTFSMKGSSSGSMQQDTWHAVGSMLVVQLRVKGDGSGMARFVSDYRLTLQSLNAAR
jgi:hypothetical protein